MLTISVSHPYVYIPYSFVMSISVLSTLAKVAKVSLVNKHQESVTDTKPLKAKDYLSTRIQTIGSYFYRLCGKLEKTISK